MKNFDWVTEKWEQQDSYHFHKGDDAERIFKPNAADEFVGNMFDMVGQVVDKVVNFVKGKPNTAQPQ